MASIRRPPSGHQPAQGDQRSHRRALVLHGGSGIPNDQLAIAFQEGINKFNVGTEYFWLYFQTLKKFTADPDANFFQLPEVVQDA